MSYLKLLLALWHFPADGGHLGKADEVKIARVCEIALQSTLLVSGQTSLPATSSAIFTLVRA